MKIISRKEAKAKGLKHYFTGKPCKRGHVTKRFTRNKSCVVCQKERLSEYRRLNPEKHREYSREYRRCNLEGERERSREHYRLNPEEARERSREHYRLNLEKYRERNCERVENLTNSYVSQRIKTQTGVLSEQQTPEMVELKRESIRITRLLKEVKHGLNGTRD